MDDRAEGDPIAPGSGEVRDLDPRALLGHVFAPLEQVLSRRDVPQFGDVAFRIQGT